MTDNSLQVRRLALSPTGKGLISFFSVAAALILAALGLWMYRRHQANEAAKREAELEKNKEPAIEILEESTQDSRDEIEDVEVAPTESEECYDRSISLCRTGTMNSLDVHACASASCDVCRQDKEPDFLVVRKLEPGTEGRIRWLTGKWWEIKDTEPPERLETITSASDFADTDCEEESYMIDDTVLSLRD